MVPLALDGPRVVVVANCASLCLALDDPRDLVVAIDTGAAWKNLHPHEPERTWDLEQYVLHRCLRCSMASSHGEDVQMLLHLWEAIVHEGNHRQCPRCTICASRVCVVRAMTGHKPRHHLLRGNNAKNTCMALRA